MKILHTADWHVGRTLRGRSRADEHRAVLAEIVGIAKDEEVDLVILAGDVFDGASPTPESEELVWGALLGLAATGAEIVLIAGNHDSPHRLKAIRPLLQLTRVHTVAFPTSRTDGGVIEIRPRSGGRARVAMLPFLSQRGVVRADQLMNGDAEEHAMAYADRCRRILAHLGEGFDDDSVNLFVAHIAVVGGQTGGGERPAHTVYDYFAPAQIFPATAHYAALGHLHRCQRIAGACPIWYPGSPLQLDFGDTDVERSVLIVEAEPGTPAAVRRRVLSSGRPLRTISGTLEQLEAVQEEVGDAFLRVTVRESPRAGLADDVRALFPNAVDVTIEHDEHAPAPGPDGERSWTKSPAELFQDYLRERGVDDPRLVVLFGQLLEEMHETGAA